MYSSESPNNSALKEEDALFCIGICENCLMTKPKQCNWRIFSELKHHSYSKYNIAP